jgi:hypothetical protein
VRKDAATVSLPTIHASLSVDGPVRRLRHPVRHYSDRNLSHHVAKLQKYASIKARDLHARGRRASLAQAFAYGVGSFLADYLRRGRFLDGGPGFAYSAMGAHATLQAYVRLWELSASGDGQRSGPDSHSGA